MLMAIKDDFDALASQATREFSFADVDPTVEDALGERAATQPERRLFFAILSDAIVRFRQLATTTNAAARVELKEAERWIRSDDRRWPCSFVNVCEALDVAYEPLRRALLSWRATPTRRRVSRRGLLISPKRSRAALLPDDE